MASEAAALARVFRDAAGDGVLEKDFRRPVEDHLIALAQAKGIDLQARTEVTLGSSGRADTIYNNFVIEWERPGALAPGRDSTKNAHAIGQVRKYADTLYFRTRQRPGRIVGCATDGRYMIFLTKPARRWISSDPQEVNNRSCKRFLDYFFSLQSGIALLPDYLSDDFSSANERTQRPIRVLHETLCSHEAAPSIAALFSQWSEFFGATTEYEQWRKKLATNKELRTLVRGFGIPEKSLDLPRLLFSIHTFFAILSKLLAYIVVGRYTNLPTPPIDNWPLLSNDELRDRLVDLENGGPFAKAGIRNYLEGDFFSWYTRYFTPELADALRAVVQRLAAYDPDTLDLAPEPTQDLLKKLYHRLVPRQVRKTLGEYYTPDWLAIRVMTMLEGGRLQGDPKKRILDPACGSGTFLVMAINSVRDNAYAQAMPPQKLLRTICSNIVGIDLNPLAVIAARTNYLLALGPLLEHRGDEPLELPVYLADSVMTPARTGHTMWEQNILTVHLSVSDFEFPATLATHEGVGETTHQIEKHLYCNPSATTDEFIEGAQKALVRVGSDWAADEPILRRLYETIAQLHAEGRNGLWTRVIRNAFAPVFLAPFDYVVGNPPWINWQNLPEGYRKKTVRLWKSHGLFVHKGMDTILGKGKKDISTLMAQVAADQYLSDGGKLAFVITQTVFKTSGAAQGFRKFQTRRRTPLKCIFVDDFSELQLFEGATNRTAVFVWLKGQRTKYPVPVQSWRKKTRGRKGSFDYDSSYDEVLDKTERKAFVGIPIKKQDVTSAWMIGKQRALRAARQIVGESAYKAHEGVNTGGANAVFWFDILHDHGDATIEVRNITEGAKRKVESARLPIERRFLYPLVRGRDVSRWTALPSAHILFVQDVERRRGIAESTLERFPHTHQWLVRHEEVLRSRAAFKRYFNPMVDPAWSLFNTGKYTLAPWKAVWAEQGSDVRCAVIGSHDGLVILPDHKVMLVATEHENEAHFIAALVNSTLFRYVVRTYAVNVQMGPHLMDNIRIPQFDSSNVRHRRLVGHAREASSANECEDAIRHLDELAASLWGLASDDVLAIRDAYSELMA